MCLEILTADCKILPEYGIITAKRLLYVDLFGRSIAGLADSILDALRLRYF
jgi:hypothetical protein